MELIPIDPIAQKILLIRGHRVMLDSDLAELYKVPTKRLNEQVRRNTRRFPPDFMLQLTPEEFDSLRPHFATLKTGRGQHRKYLPYAFTEQGVAMLLKNKLGLLSPLPLRLSSAVALLRRMEERGIECIKTEASRTK
ncbi:MAG: ORF6N domain-containing protein [Nitrospirota bacterium]